MQGLVFAKFTHVTKPYEGATAWVELTPDTPAEHEALGGMAVISCELHKEGGRFYLTARMRSATQDKPLDEQLAELPSPELVNDEQSDATD